MEELQALICNIKLSSIGPGKVTGPDLTVEPANIDMAMKLHYLRCVYYFESPAFEGLTTTDVKRHMFLWLNRHPITCGRFRRTDSGRAHIKCNDCGVRFIEADCNCSLHEWLEAEDENLLCSDRCIGPELSFSPLIYVQLTKFKCGGAAVGLNWAHVLGDAFTAAEYMNSLGRVVAGLEPYQPVNMARNLTGPKTLPKPVEDPLSIKRVGPVGDNWAYATKSKMGTFSFNVSPMQLSYLQTKLNTSSTFESISVVVWKCIATIRGGELEPRIVTICKRSESNYGNNQVVSVVKADFPIVDADYSELVALVQNEAVDERRMIEEAMERDGGLGDYIVYGANLTFVNLEEVKFYDFVYRGQRPIGVSYGIGGVGEKGAVLVIPAKRGDGGRTVVAILPETETEMVGLKSELKREGLIA